MPELPDVNIYVEALRERILGHKLIRTLVKSPFLLRTAAPPLSATHESTVHDVRRLGKQIAIGVAGDLWLVLHLKIAGRLHWSTPAPKLGSRNLLAAFEFDRGWLWLTEAGTQRRASLHVVEGEAGLQSMPVVGILILSENQADLQHQAGEIQGATVLVRPVTMKQIATVLRERLPVEVEQTAEENQ